MLTLLKISKTFRRSGISLVKKLFYGFLGAGCLLGGCATSPFSQSIQTAANTQPPFSSIIARPQAYEGRILILGGEILRTQNLPSYSEIEVLQEPLNQSDRPQKADVSFGRFLIRCPGYLDPTIYAKGRQISVAGKLQGQEARPIYQLNYVYPVVDCLKLHLWPIPEPEYYNRPVYGYDRWWGRPGFYPYFYWRYPYW